MNPAQPPGALPSGQGLQLSVLLEVFFPHFHIFLLTLLFLCCRLAEAIGILGTIGAIANIVDDTVKAASGLRELHNRWKDADFTLLNLITQIIALKAALS